MEKKFVFELTDAQVQLIGNGLAELPLKQVKDLFNYLEREYVRQKNEGNEPEAVPVE